MKPEGSIRTHYVESLPREATAHTEATVWGTERTEQEANWTITAGVQGGQLGTVVWTMVGV